MASLAQLGAGPGPQMTSSVRRGQLGEAVPFKGEKEHSRRGGLESKVLGSVLAPLSLKCTLSKKVEIRVGFSS